MALCKSFRAARGFVSFLTAAALAIVAGLGVYITNACRLRAIDGERVFYLDSNTSQGLRKTELELRDYARITGESVHFARKGRGAEEIAQEVANRYGAKILFTEEAAGVISYYCYTDIWDNGVAVGGQTVNLHIAVAEEVCAVGTPVIFGGF